MKTKKERVTVVSEMRRPVAPLELLLSVAESKLDKDKPQTQAQADTDTPQASTTKAIIENGYVRLCNGKRKKEDVAMKYSTRNLYSAMFSDFSPDCSKYLLPKLE